ncbi:hypothetical protein BDN70DRAFT_801232 [Pholiota conissans]|uniref:Sorting nexin MVP1 n=1 Tax=Pholiota conissans TaxID=109636 RepID=A0A9P5ZAS3_9AGAR|nr:hypothetical protein BDN70DRAFT_801232 [Pholiota conissans]
MFNAPRPAQRYTGSTSNGGFGGSFVDDNPLANSVYDDGLDPWSAAPSPTPTPAPQAPPSVFSAVIADATVPSIYHRSYAAVDPANAGETSVNALSRVLNTSGLPASTIERIVNLVSSKPRVSKLEFFVALALVALAQSGKDVSIEQVAALSSQNTLPEPTLDLDRLQPSLSTIPPVAPISRKSTTPTVRAPLPAYSSDDPWNTNLRFPTGGSASTPFGVEGLPTNGATSSLAGTGLPNEWWKKQETIKVSILGQQGFILNRYTVYEVASERRPHPVSRRYSEFVFLWDVLVRRYPFRLFPSLPPKRVGADEQFLEQRRRGLARSLNFVVNHPIMKDDGVLNIFLSEPSFEAWRKQNAVSFDEESASKRVDKIEEMSIPSDLEDKLAVVRGKISPLIEQWQRICILAERIIKRREAAAVRTPPALRRAFLPTYFTLPPLSPSSTNSSLPDGPASPSMTGSLSQSFLGFNIPAFADTQGDLARLTNTLRSVIEVNETCWRGDDCELSNGVRAGLTQVAAHTQRHSEISEMRSRSLQDTTLESLKAQRDLYLATRDLFIRHDRLSLDQVERLKKRIETTSVKLDGIRAAQKDNWQEEAERLTAMIEKDQATIAAQLHRRIFIRACMWHELRVVLHNRENALLTQAVKRYAREEHEYAENVANNWESLSEAVEGMPFE